MTVGRSALRTSDRFMITAEAEAFRPACAALPVAFFLRESADAEVAAVAAAGEPLRAAECAVAVVRSPEAGLAGSVAASVPAPGSLPDDCSAPADLVLDDCWAAPQSDDRSVREVLAHGCSAVAELTADDSVPDGYSALADSAADDSARDDYSATAESVLDACSAAPRADDRSVSDVQAYGCSARAGSAADDSVPDDYSALADSVLDDCSAALQGDDHSAPEALLAGCSAPLDLVGRDCSERAGSAADDSARGGLAPADYSAQADSPDDSPADCWVGSPEYWTADSPDGSRLAPRACLRPRLLLEADSQPDVREPFSASPDEAEVDLDAPPTAAAGPRKPA